MLLRNINKKRGDEERNDYKNKELNEGQVEFKM